VYIADNSIDRIAIHEPLQDSRHTQGKVTVHQANLGFNVCCV